MKTSIHALILGVRRWLPLLLAGGSLAMLPLPAMAESSETDPYTGKTLTGDWNGRRSKLANMGIAFRGSFIDEGFHVAQGGLDRGTRNATQTQVGVDLDMDKLTSFWGDGRFHVTIDDRRGRNVSDELAGNAYMPIQWSYFETFTRWGEVSYDQNFFRQRLNWRIGFYSMGNHFGTTGIASNFVNAALTGHPFSYSTTSGWVNFPRPRWTSHLTFYATPELVVRGGLVLVNTNYNLRKNRWSLYERGTRGHLYPLELEWMPGTADHGHFPGRYKLGYYYDSTERAMAGDRSAWKASHTDGGYVYAEQKLTNNTVDGGLSLFAHYTRQTQKVSPIHTWSAVGFVYQGIFHRRPQDSVALGYVRASINQHLLRHQRQQAAMGLITREDWLLDQAEELWELSYSYQLTPWLTLRPNVQYITHPGTFSYRDIDNVLAVGAQVRVRF